MTMMHSRSSGLPIPSHRNVVIGGLGATTMALALLVGGSVLLSEPVAFARNANKPSFADQRSKHARRATRGSARRNITSAVPREHR